MEGVFPCYRCGDTGHLARDCDEQMPKKYEGVIERGDVWWKIDKYDSLPPHPIWYPGKTYKIANLPFHFAVQRTSAGDDTIAMKVVALWSAPASDWRVVVRWISSGIVRTFDAEHPSVGIDGNDFKSERWSCFQVLDIVGVPFGMMNFHKPPADCSADDVVVLLLDNQRVHVPKHYLTTHSGVFRRMFKESATAQLGQAKKEPVELPLPNTVVEHFVELLRVDLEGKPIDKNNLEVLMKVADKFEMQDMLVKCESFLMYNNNSQTGPSANNIGSDDSSFSIQERLQFASQYQFNSLLNKVVNSLTSLKQIKRDVYGVGSHGRIDAQAQEQYSKTVNAAIKDRIVNLL